VVREDLERRWLLMPIRGADPHAPVPRDHPLEEISGAEGEPIRPVVVGGPPGGRLLLFTGTEALRRWRRAARFLAAPGGDLLALGDRLGVAEVVVDAEGPRPARLALSGSPPRRPPADRWGVRPMAGPVDAGALFRLRRRMASHVPVSALYLFEVTLDGRDLLAAGFDVEGTSDQAASGVVRAAARSIGPLLPVDLYAGVQFVALEDERLAARARAVDPPVYLRDRDARS
jgi:hypothetical protein